VAVEIGSAPRETRSTLVAALAVVASLALFVPLAAEAWQSDVPTWDAKVSRGLRGYEERSLLSGRIDVLDLILHPSVQLAGLLVIASVLLVMAARGRFRQALMIGVAVGGVLVFEPILKNLFARPPVEPGGSGYTFPSGSAMRSVAAAASLTIVAWPTLWRWPTALLGTLVAALIGIAVVYQSWHWPSDVLGGWCVSVTWVAAVWLAFTYLPRRAGAAKVDGVSRDAAEGGERASLGSASGASTDHGSL
jgi:membrane-associated phospholipid phosphatase